MCVAPILVKVEWDGWTISVGPRIPPTPPGISEDHTVINRDHGTKVVIRPIGEGECN